MTTTYIMKDLSFTPILFEIERRILVCVRLEKADGIDMNDSQIHSILNKVRKSLEALVKILALRSKNLGDIPIEA